MVGLPSSLPRKDRSWDVAVIGAGVVGALTARALAAAGLRVIILERGADPDGATKANSGIIHPGYDPEPGTLKERMGLEGARRFEAESAALGVPFRRTGSLMLAFDQREVDLLGRYLVRGQKRGLKGLRLLGREEVLTHEPAVNPEVVAALYAPQTAVASPFEVAVAAVGAAIGHGAEAWREAEVIEVDRNSAGQFRLRAGGVDIRARWLINAAGLGAARLAAMAGHKGLKVHGRAGEYVLFDREVGGLVKMVLYPVPTATSKGILVVPTVHGNLLVGPNALDLDDDAGRGNPVTAAGLAEVIRGARRLVPGLPLDRIITTFAGTRAVAPGGDFVIEASSQVPGLINLAGVASPGLTAAPAIAAEVLRMVIGPAGTAGPEELEKLTGGARTTPMGRCSVAGGGRVICRCEGVTEAAVVAAIRSPFGAYTVDGVKQRTRAGMGRCQGAFCGPRVVEILARELGLPAVQVTKSGAGSKLFVGRTKEASG